MRAVVFLLLACVASVCVAEASPAVQIQAVHDMILRITPEHASSFSLQIVPLHNNSDYWSLESVNGQIVVTGNSGVSLASGYNYYLKYKCNAQYTWRDEQMHIPSPLPPVSSKITRVSPYALRYYYNVCTLGYSTAFWNWERWQREVDWMALNSINMPLAFAGQEYVWLELFADLGMDRDQVRKKWFSGAAFLPWNRMGNLNKWAGPLSSAFLSSRVLLQKQILQRQRAFGMKPILPGFAGHVPPGFKEMFPNATVTELVWAPEFGTTYFLHADDPLFEKIGNMFLTKQEEIYGTDHYYNADPFNEMEPSSQDPAYLATVSKGIYAGMTKTDPEAIWVLQGWFLLSEDFWRPAQTKAFLDAVPDDKLIVLDLWAEIVPYWKGHDKFYGKQYIWCMLHDFGGRSGLYAAVDYVNDGVVDSLQSAPNMVGIGLTPEAIETNPVIYDFMMEFAWQRNRHDVSTWMSAWAHRRYGRIDSHAANYWNLLAQDILNCKTTQMGPSVPVYIARPNVTLPEVVGCCGDTGVYYSPSRLVTAWSNLLLAHSDFRALNTYRNDVVEITRQVLGDLTLPAWKSMIHAYNRSDLTSFTKHAQTFLSLINDIDTICATQRDYLLGPWVSDAALWGVTPDEVAQMTHNAILQKTLWGPATFANGLHEYAYKIWSGLVDAYYGKRWAMFIEVLRETIHSPGSYNPKTFHQEMFSFEWKFGFGPVPPTTPTGDAYTVSSSLFSKWQPRFRSLATLETKAEEFPSDVYKRVITRSRAFR